MNSEEAPTPRKNAARGLAAVTRTRKDAVYGALEAAILELEIPPGARLVEADLADEFGISKTPIREALLLLERSRLIELIPYSGAHVTWLSIDEYIQLTTILDSLELPALELLAKKIGPAELARIEELENLLIGAFERRDGFTYRNNLLSLHESIFSMAGNPHLIRILMEVGKLARRYEVAFTHRFDDTWSIELDIVRARVDSLRRGRPQAVTQRVDQGHRQLLEVFKSRVETPQIAPFLDPAAYGSVSH